MESTSKEIQDAVGKTIEGIYVVTTNVESHSKDGVEFTLERRIKIDLTDGTSVDIKCGHQKN